LGGGQTRVFMIPQREYIRWGSVGKEGEVQAQNGRRDKREIGILNEGGGPSG